MEIEIHHINQSTSTLVCGEVRDVLEERTSCSQLPEKMFNQSIKSINKSINQSINQSIFGDSVDIRVRVRDYSWSMSELTT